MKPEQFIREYGVEKAREVVEGAPNGTTHIHSVTWQNYKQGDSNNYVWGRSGQEGWYLSIYETLNGMMVLEDLKRLVESLDLIKFYDGIERAKLKLAMGTCLSGRPPHPREVELRQAIRDHESIYGGGDD